MEEKNKRQWQEVEAKEILKAYKGIKINKEANKTTLSNEGNKALGVAK